MEIDSIIEQDAGTNENQREKTIKNHQVRRSQTSIIWIVIKEKWRTKIRVNRSERVDEIRLAREGRRKDVHLLQK